MGSSGVAGDVKIVKPESFRESIAFSVFLRKSESLFTNIYPHIDGKHRPAIAASGGCFCEFKRASGAGAVAKQAACG